MSGNANSGYRPPSRWEPCGTAAAYRRHVRRKEPADQACKDAHAAYAREHYVPVPATARVTRLSAANAARSRATRERNRQRSQARAEDYAWLRDSGIGEREAGRRAGLHDRVTVIRYERAYQDGKTRQREEAA